PDFTLGRFGYFPSYSSLSVSQEREERQLAAESHHGSGSRLTANAAPHHAGPPSSCRELLRAALTRGQPWTEKARLLELALRAAPLEELPALAALFLERWQAAGEQVRALPALLRTLVNEVSLSPWTQLVDHLLRFVHLLGEAESLPSGWHVD